MQNSEIKMLVVVLAIMFFILLCLVATLVFLKIRANMKDKEEDNKKIIDDSREKSKSKVQQNYDVKSVLSFMEFDKVEDNMVVQKNGKRFLMIVKCQGVNYDLMSGVEKTSVEQGFIQFLNTLRYPVQIYIQTRTVDLGDSISKYKDKVRVLGDNLAQKEFEYNQKVRSGELSEAELAKENFEVVKARNLYEYGMDIVTNTERMSLNKNILSKQYYVVIPYYPEEAGTGDYAKEEISSAAFSELYTRAQSIISLLSVCGINSKILDSFEISKLLYMAYNRDEAEQYDLQKVLNSGFDEMYTTAPNVLDKRMKELDKQIEIEANRKANEAIIQVKAESEKEKALKQKEREFSNLIAKMSKIILENNKSILGKEVVDKAKEKIDNESKEKEESPNVQKQSKTGRPKKLA